MSDEKPLDATPSRIARARREGDIPRAGELIGAAAFGAAAITAVTACVPIASLARRAFAASAAGRFDASYEFGIVALGVLPAAAGATFAVLTAVAQNGGVPALALRVQVARLNPFGGLRRMASRETPAHVLRAACAFAAALLGMAPIVEHAIALAARSGSLVGVAAATASAARATLFVACAVGLLFAVAEYALVRGAWLRRLRMSVEELKREMKEQEGDPHARGRRKARHRELSRGALSKVGEAAFVVANPTHVAVALAYRPPEIAVPLILVRAAGFAALRVRELACALGVPVVEQPALARALYARARIGAPIPAEQYVAVAEIVVALTRENALQ
ncbi:MAG: EscU/YscU/HrcU family type III secretion system export apparatus switch protein [Candidatus Tyrphobacter sp.]